MSAPKSKEKVSGPGQHFVPQLLLRKFTDDKGQLHFFDKRISGKGVLISTPEDLFRQRHIYSTIDSEGKRNTVLDQQYQELEKQAARVISKVIDSVNKGIVPDLDVGERRVWDSFLYNQWRRVPDMHGEYLTDENIRSAFADSIGELESKFRPLTDEEKSRIRNAPTEWIQSARQDIKVRVLSKDAGKVQEVLAKKGLCVAVITKPNKSFIIGSFPVVKIAHLDRPHLLEPTTQVWLPISSKVAISPAPYPSHEIRVIQIKDPGFVRHLNETMLKQSTTIAGCSPKLIASLAGVSLKEDGGHNRD